MSSYNKTHLRIDPEKHFLGEGANKICYNHPKDESLCVKVLKDRPCAKRRTKREIKTYKQLKRRKVTGRYIAHYFGTIETNLGRGYLFEYLSVDETILDTFSAEELKEKLQLLYEHCYRDAVVLSDLHADNLVVRDDGQLCIIDGLGSGEFIPICYWSKYFTRRKLSRKFKRLAKELKTSLQFHEVKFFHKK